MIYTVIRILIYTYSYMHIIYIVYYTVKNACCNHQRISDVLKKTRNVKISMNVNN